METKYNILANLLREELIRNGGVSGYKFPTEAELTRRYRMSRQTVRRAIRILAEEGLVQSRQGSGTYATGKPPEDSPRQVAILTSFADDYIFPAILHDAQAVFSQQEYPMLVYATENQVGKERDILCKLLEGPVKGILVEGSKTALPSPNIDLYQRLRQQGIPMVFLHGAYAELTGISCISDDNYGGGYLLVRYLREHGHQDIAGIFKSDDIQGPQRYHGVVSAIRDAGLPINDRFFCWYDTHDRLEMLGQHPQTLHRFLEHRLHGATAVICYNDEVAFLLIRELLALGKKVPGDIAVVSFDNSYYSQIGPVRITSLRHKNHKVGRVAAEQLIRMFHGLSATSHILEWELIERDSSISVKNG